jgi:hypothetical protein
MKTHSPHNAKKIVPINTIIRLADIYLYTTRKTAFRVGQKWTLKGQKPTLKPI